MNISHISKIIIRNPAVALRKFKNTFIRNLHRLVASSAWKYPGSQRSHEVVLPIASYAPWRDDIAFNKVYQSIRQFTLVDIYRCYELWSLGKQAAALNGSFLEVGVWRGGTGVILAEALRQAKSENNIYLADTFVGVVKAGEEDTIYVGGEHSDTSVELVQSLFTSRNLKNSIILKGIFPDDTQSHVRGPIALLHCDVDVYSSSKDIVNWCLPRLISGAILIFDDYGFYGCEGVTKYCEELKNSNEFLFIHNLNGHAIFVKK